MHQSQNPYYALMTMELFSDQGTIKRSLDAKMIWNGCVLNYIKNTRSNDGFEIFKKDHDIFSLTEDELSRVNTKLVRMGKNDSSQNNWDLNLLDFNEIKLSNIRISNEFNIDNFIIPSKIDFEHCQFSKKTSFNNTQFLWLANFSNVTFEDTVEFINTEFEEAIFTNAQFKKKTIFQSTKFNGLATFDDAIFNDYIYFNEKVVFNREARFNRSEFKNIANFTHCIFRRNANFNHSIFSSNLIMNLATTHEDIDFSNVRFLSGANFDACDFTYPPQFFECNLHENTTFKHFNWPVPKFEHEALIFIPRYERLKLLMNRQNRYNSEHMFLREELKCREIALKKNKDKSLSDRFEICFSGIYGFASDYGWSISKPAIYLVILWFSLGTLIWGFETLYCNSEVGFLKSYAISFANLFNFLGFNKVYLSDEINSLSEISSVLSAIETILGIILMFLLLLALRNHYRMK